MARRERLGYEMIATIIFCLVLVAAAGWGVATYYMLTYREIAKEHNIVLAEKLQAELENNIMKSRVNNLINELQNKNKISDAIKNRRRGR
jgi:hypothetical protein